MNKFEVWSATFLISCVFFVLGAISVYALEVNSYYGTYDASQKEVGRPSTSLEGPVRETWNPPAKANRPYKIGVLFPHLKDPYWLAVNYGIISEAKKLGVGIKLMTAGGYRRHGNQRRQLTKDLMQEGVDGVILAAISYNKIDKNVGQVNAKGIPVVEVINDILAPTIKAKALVSFLDMGYGAGKYVVEDSGDKRVKVGFLPGPKGSGWAPDTFMGFEKALKDHNTEGRITVIPPQYGDTGYKMQGKLVRFILKKYNDVDYIVGNAVAAEAAVEIVKKFRTKHPNVKIVSTYIIPGVYNQILKGNIAAAPSDLTAAQGKMAVDMMVRILNGERPGDKTVKFPFRSGPIIPVVTLENIEQYPYEMHFGEKNFKPVLNLEPGE